MEHWEPTFRYTIRAYHRADTPRKWESTSGKFWPGFPEGLAEALEHAEMMNSHPGNPKGLWVYAVFEYHGKRDYRLVTQEE